MTTSHSFAGQGFDGLRTFGEMDDNCLLKQTREDEGISRAELAPLVGLHSGLRAVRAGVLSKDRHSHDSFLLTPPIDILFEAAPHLWGEDTRRSPGPPDADKTN